MHPQELFTNGSIDKLRKRLKEKKDVDLYLGDRFIFENESIVSNPRIKAPDKINFLLPRNGENYDFENAKIIFEDYKELSFTHATDVRLWAYLAHVPLWKYMKRRYPIEKQPRPKRGGYILEHWFINGVSPQNFVRHGISLLWWGARLTHDPTRRDPYELTRELFSMLDYTRTLVPGTQGRNQNFTRALLEFVIENENLFSQYKEGRVRFLMRKVNYLGGYKIIPVLSKDEIKGIFKKYEREIRMITTS